MHRNFRRHAGRSMRGRFGPPAGRGRHKRGGGGRRLFEHGDLRWAMLALIAEKTRHGYELIKEIEERSGGAYAPSPGVIYPALSLLEELGYVALASAEAGKKAYAITAEGRTVLNAHRAEVDALFAQLAESRARAPRPPPELQRAWDALRASLNAKVSAAPLSPDQARSLESILAEAAGKIERS